MDESRINPPPAHSFIRNLSGHLMADGQRVSVSLTLSSIKSGPSVEFTLTDLVQKEVTQATVIGIKDPKLNFTLHLLDQVVEYPLQVTATLFDDNENVLETSYVIVTDLAEKAN